MYSPYGGWTQRTLGSPQESDEACILCGSLQSDEFGLGKRQSLCFEQQILDVAIAATAAQQRFDVSIDRLHHAQRHFGSTVVQDPLPVIEQHPSQLLHRLQPLPAQLLDPTLQVAQHGTLIGVGPQSV